MINSGVKQEKIILILRTFFLFSTYFIKIILIISAERNSHSTKNAVQK